ncbi:MAG: hypothetical protein HKP60_03895 [Eudoraea sp.]|nr:hypothetical protein [Eudoraea sp.]NNJ39995.1 hypothetical protein [Eudoraea sp.]
MKHLVLLIAAFFVGVTSTTAASAENELAFSNVYGYNNSFIFVNNGITFSVYPDGEFDFYINNRLNVSAGIGVGSAGITFNSGYNYNPFVQYDDFGAVIQVENMPVYYDYHGRVSQIGDVNIWYRNGRVRRIGGMRVFYNNFGAYQYHTGYINFYNRYYVYRPFHRFFIRPAVGFCLVYNRPYRRFYSPVRYTWYRPYRNNYRRSYAQIGRDYRYNRGLERRRSIYRNDKRVAVRDNRARRDGYRNDAGTLRRDKATNGRRSTAYRSESVNRNGNTKSYRNNRTAAVKRNTAATNNIRRSAAQKRSNKVVQTRTVKRSSAANGKRTVTRSTQAKRTQRIAPARKTTRTQTVAKRSVSRKPAYKAPSKRSRSSAVSKSPKRVVTKSSSTRSRSRSGKTTSRSRRSL